MWKFGSFSMNFHVSEYPSRPSEIRKVLPWVLDASQTEQLLSQGYTVIKNVIPADVVKKALGHISSARKNENYVLRNGSGLPSFYDAVQEADQIMNLMTTSSLQRLLESIYDSEIEILGGAGQIAIRPVDEDLVKRGVDKHKRANRTAWHVDEGGSGKYVQRPADFSLLVGVALTDSEGDVNSGQLNVWPGSHVKLHEALQEHLRRDVEGITPNVRFTEGRPDIGKPVRVCVLKGDVVLAHQRLGHCGGPNVVQERIMVYFRVRKSGHGNSNGVRERWMRGDGVWTGFDGLLRKKAELASIS
ncbi:hypothetical protein BWQ96_08534 [Gracilariopsis chorda]|uniref:Phytanoyl-CoA dioxygenase n=1 Tax=Gracilariopsis chorda TaxID=448386 RepID=A0A2V3II10_9FLOR|nr:hypothetical protein BWQ96_08534 [Gracilariopsis chorda]|eukprot:PXF41745.1 hypothetical protein BWQ96_08534 [Gracilariopsis chorda]